MTEKKDMIVRFDRPLDRLRARLRFWLTVVGIQFVNIFFVTMHFIFFCFFRDRSYWVFGVPAMSLYLLFGGVRVKTVGAEKLRPKRAALYVSSHQSHFDIPASMKALPVRFHFIAKKELLKIPVFGWSLPSLGMIMIDRSTREKAYESIREAARCIRERNWSVLIYPEGGISKTGILKPFKKGAFNLAIQSQVPIVPILVRDSGRLFSAPRMESRPGTMILEVLDEIATTGFTEGDEEKLRDIVFEKMKQAEQREAG